MNKYLPILLIALVGCGPSPDESARAKGKATAVVEVASILSKPVEVVPDVPKPGVCPSCNGTGKTGDGLSVCNECGGDGKIEHVPAESNKPVLEEKADSPPKPADREVEQQALINPELTKPREVNPEPAQPERVRLSAYQVAKIYTKRQGTLNSYRLPGESNEQLVERFLASNPHLDPRLGASVEEPVQVYRRQVLDCPDCNRPVRFRFR